MLNAMQVQMMGLVGGILFIVKSNLNITIQTKKRIEQIKLIFQ